MSTYYAGYGAVDPGPFETECRDRGLPTDWFGTCNLFEVPLGKGPGRGRVLLRKSDLDLIDLTADHDLKLSDPAGNVITLKSITLLRATCVDPGAAASPDAVYLCELADRRWHLARVPVDLAFNVRNYDGTDYLPESLLIGAPYTWQKVVDSLAVTTLGLPAFTLPYSPDESPANLTYFGGWAWDALCDVLARLACAAKYDPTTDVFTVVQLGDPTAVAAFDAARAVLAGEKTWDTYPVEPDRGRRPGKVRVLFPRRPQPQDGTSVYHHEDVTLTSAPGVVAGSYVTLDGDLTADGAVAGSPTNAAALATRAAERAADYLRKLTGFDRRVGLVYRDDRPEAVPQLLGAAAGSVLFDDRGGPVRTEVRAGPGVAPRKMKPLRLDSCVSEDFNTFDPTRSTGPFVKDIGDGNDAFTVGGIDTANPRQTVLKIDPGYGSVWVEAGVLLTVSGTLTVAPGSPGTGEPVFFHARLNAVARVVTCSPGGTLIGGASAYVPVLQAQLRGFVDDWPTVTVLPLTSGIDQERVDLDATNLGVSGGVSGSVVTAFRVARPSPGDDPRYYTIEVTVGADGDGVFRTFALDASVESYGIGGTWLRADPACAHLSQPPAV